MRIVNIIVSSVVMLACCDNAFAIESLRPKEPNVAEAGNRFAVDLYRQLDKEQSGNLFFSPGSISVALAMTMAGARGRTEAEMAEVLHLAGNREAIGAAYGKLLRQWNEDDRDRGYQLRVANRLWGQRGYKILDPFLVLTRRCYGAEMALVDYVGDAEGARLEINTWVEKQTEDKIKDLLQQGVIDNMTRLVLTNAVYFKGDWDMPFEESSTRKQDFKLSAAKTVKAPLMYQTEWFGYFEQPELQVLEMPYRGEDLSMIVLLPKAIDGLDAVERSLTLDKLKSLQSKLQWQKVRTYMPKFKLESSFNLNNTLKSIGMKLAFSQSADFSGISGHKDLYLSDVVHKAFVDVNESGTEAAAATAAVMTMKSAPPPPRPIPVFRADHPFIFMIRENRTGGILFLGRVVNPNG